MKPRLYLSDKSHQGRCVSLLLCKKTIAWIVLRIVVRPKVGFGAHVSVALVGGFKARVKARAPGIVSHYMYERL